MSVESKLQGIRQILKFDNRLHLILQRLIFRGDRLGVYRMGPLEFVVDHTAGDASGAPDVLTRPMYADYLPQLAQRQPASVLDIGANAGGFPLFLALHDIAIGRLVSVELNPRTCIRLRFNLERNLRGDLQVMNAALCGRSGPLQVRLGEGSVADSLYDRSFNATGATTEVPGLTFDELHRQAFGDAPVDICKIDIEQAEYEMIDNPGHERLRYCRLIVMEIHQVAGRSQTEVVRHLEGLGFALLPQQSDRSVFVFVNQSASVPPRAS